MAASSKSNLIDSTEAMDIVAQYGKRISKPTIIKWVRKNKLGYQYIPGSRWYIDKTKLIRLLETGKAS